jgi:DNA-binding NarL/FixJ family response regulator
VTQAADVVLLVDDAPSSVGALASELEAEGYTVLLASDGLSALERLRWITPDAILLDAVMPGLDGFETCRRVKAEPAWAHVPVIFMTGLAETEHVLAGFAAGGVDYVVKPLRAAEVLARLSAHVRNARTARLVREAVDIGGQGVVMLDGRGRLAWCSPKAREWMMQAYGPDTAAAEHALLQWLLAPTVASVASPLEARALGTAGVGETMWLLSLRAPDAVPSSSRVIDASLTPREAEVLSWVAKGKTNRDIGDILGMSPRTVNKHLEHVFEKLGVETRAAAAALASHERKV